jgi:hypothetical protein
VHYNLFLDGDMEALRLASLYVDGGNGSVPERGSVTSPGIIGWGDQARPYTTEGLSRFSLYLMEYADRPIR